MGGDGGWGDVRGKNIVNRRGEDVEIVRKRVGSCNRLHERQARL